MIPQDAPPVFGLNTHRSRVEHKLQEARYFYNRLAAKDVRYTKLTKAKTWNRALDEMNEWMFYASAFISAVRSTYYYLHRATKATDDENKSWLIAQEKLPVHEIGRDLRDFMLHEATPNAGYEVDLSPPKPGETKGDWVVRGLMQEPRNPRIQVSIEETLPNLSEGAKKFAKGRKTITDLFGTILAAMEQLVAEAQARNMLSEAPIGPGVSTKRKR